MAMKLAAASMKRNISRRSMAKYYGEAHRRRNNVGEEMPSAEGYRRRKSEMAAKEAASAYRRGNGGEKPASANEAALSHG
jgi:hypothetical protein